MTVAALFPIVVALTGLAVAALGVNRSRQPAAADPAAYLRTLDAGDDADDFSQKLAQPFVGRALAPVARSVFETVRKLTPGDHVARVHQKLLVAGLSQSMRAEEFVTLQVVSAAGGILLAGAYLGLGHASGPKGFIAAALLLAIGTLGPYAWLSRKGAERAQAIFMDLPDVIDLLAISVEAGVGFEGALDVVVSNFTSPLATEFTRTLKEMELGLSRREALVNLKRRTEVPELSNFVLAITQADALGMPLGRVLHTQAEEMRMKRRQWAREKAGKLPVKILFPLVAFIFPVILVVILGPVVGPIGKAFK
jgi:tight adherence protein C